MKKVLAIFVLAVIGIMCSAAGPRIDINGTQNKIALKPAGGSEGMTVVNAGWMKTNKEYYLMAYSYKITDKWQKYSFSFIPDKTGEVSITFRGHWHKPKGAPKNIPVWTAYDNIKIVGTEAKNSDFEFVNQKNLFDGWNGCLSNMVTGSENAQSGKNYVIVWHDSPIYQTLKMKKGQKVTITFYAKKATGKESKPKAQ
jgi:hypothetical protein